MKTNTLIIGCTDHKQLHPSAAIELYKGQVFQTLYANTNGHPLEHFNVLILSGKHGLIDANEIISPYSLEVPAERDKDALKTYISEHKSKARKLLKKYANTNLFVVMPNKYLNVFDLMFGQRELKMFNSRYVCRGHRGSIQMNSRLKRLIHSVYQGTPTQSIRDITIFRSGVSNVNDYTGYHLNRQAKGYTLATVGPNKYPKLYSRLIEDLKEGIPCFLDNGIVTALNQGKKINASDVLYQYRVMVESLPPRLLKHLFVVIPDDPFCSRSAINIVRKHSQEIRYIAKKTNCIVPMHRYAHEEGTKLEAVATEIMSALRNVRVVLGVPCKATMKDKVTGITLQPRLLSSELEKLLSLKIADRPLFNSIHCLGMSEVTKGSWLSERIGVAMAYGVSMTMDCCRTSALFTVDSDSRKAAAGTKLISELEPDIEIKKVESTASYRDYGREQEHDEPSLYEKARELIELDPNKFTELYNRFESPMMQIDHLFDCEIEQKEYLESYLSEYPSIIEDQLITVLKKMFVRELFWDGEQANSLDKRTEAIAQLTAIKGVHSERQAVQLPLI